MTTQTLSRPRSVPAPATAPFLKTLAPPDRPRLDAHRLGLCAVAACALLAALPGLLHDRITGLDQAHHIASSIFFHDALRDLPLRDPAGYTFDYYRQYPALGFTFWPPVFHAAAGAMMTVIGPGVFAARLTLALFTVVLAVALYLGLRRGGSPWAAVLATAAALTTPLMLQLENSVMLEVPLAAMVALTLVAYFRLIDRGAWSGWGEVLLASGLCAAIVYTKQPGVFLLPALLLDLAWNHRPLLRDRRTWALVGLVVLWCLPLALFTLKFGRVNLEQSFGNAGNIYVSEHRVAERWSLEGWTYYLLEVPRQVHLIVILLALAGAGMVVARPELRRRHGVWMTYLLCWYLLFTYFDNKQPRFVSAVVPGLAALAVIAIARGAGGALLRQNAAAGDDPAPRLPGGASLDAVGRAAAAALLVLVLYQSATATTHVNRGYAGLRELTAELVQPELDGNLLFFGGDYQLFVPWVRLLDPTGQVHVLKGDDVVSTAGTLPQALHDYRVRYVFAATDGRFAEMFHAACEDLPDGRLTHRGRYLFDNGHKAFEVDLYAAVGPVAEQMARVPLSSEMHGATVD